MLRIKVFSLFVVIIISCLSAQSGANIRYYLTEFDFLSDYYVPQSATIGKFHYRIEYDRLDRVVVKDWRDSGGERIKSEHFHYQVETLSLIEKKIYDFHDQLIEFTIYGQDSLSTLFAEYTFNAILTADWDDRFTVIYYSNSKADSCHFSTADGQIYGRIIYRYDKHGRMVSQVWEDLLAKKVVRNWAVIYDSVTGITRTVETDANGHIVSDFRLRADGAEEAFVFLSPDNPCAIMHMDIAYRLYTDLESGYLTWEWISGSEDILTTHTYNLYGVDLLKGDHIIDLGEIGVLSENAFYRLSACGKTRSGNEMVPTYVDSLRIDVTPADLTLRVIPNSVRPQVAFTSSEPLAFAELIYSARGGNEIIIPFTNEESALIDDSLFIPIGQTALDSNVNYSAVLKAQDLAGNWSISSTFTGLQFDSRPPGLTIVKPVAGDYVNDLDIIFSSDEALFSLTAIWEWSGGVSDTLELYSRTVTTLSWTSSELDTLMFTSITLQDSAVYKLKIKATDLTGNNSDWITIGPVHYDITAPVITSIFPYNDAVIQENSVSYVFNEPLSYAEYRWKPVAGMDTVKYHVIPLVGFELTPEKKIHIQLTNTPDLIAGARYNVTLTGYDRAGNKGDMIMLENILYDPSDE